MRWNQKFKIFKIFIALVMSIESALFQMEKHELETPIAPASSFAGIVGSKGIISSLFPCQSLGALPALWHSHFQFHGCSWTKFVSC